MSESHRRQAANVAPIKQRNIDWFWKKNENWLQGDFPPPHPMLCTAWVALMAPMIWAGEGGAGKSTSLMDLSIRTAYWVPGMTWLGQPIPKPPTGKVIMFAAEANEVMARKLYLQCRGKQYRDAWLAANPDIDPESDESVRLKIFTLEDVEPLFVSDGDNVKPTDMWLDLCEGVRLWGADLIIVDTISALASVQIDSNTNHAQGMLRIVGKLAATGPAVIMGHHIVKTTDTKTWREFRGQIKGSAGWVDGSRAAGGLWAAPPKLAKLIVDLGLGGATDLNDVICAAIVKENIEELRSKQTRVFVRQPKEGPYYVDAIDVTDDLIAHPCGVGKDALEGFTFKMPNLAAAIVQGDDDGEGVGQFVGNDGEDKPQRRQRAPRSPNGQRRGARGAA